MGVQNRYCTKFYRANDFLAPHNFKILCGAKKLGFTRYSIHYRAWQSGEAPKFLRLAPLVGETGMTLRVFLVPHRSFLMPHLIFYSYWGANKTRCDAKKIHVD